jgi:DNA-binding IclR family transcriptional regulator
MLRGQPMTLSFKDNAGVQSIEIGAALLRALAGSDGPMKLTDLADATGMSTSRAHKYLASFTRCGLVRQSGPSGRYGLGPLAAELGYAAVRSMDVVALAQETLDDLRDRLQTVVSLTVFANRGPTIIRRSVHEQSVSLVVQLGAVMTMLTSANGRVFSAYLPKELSAPLIALELKDPQGHAARAGLRTMRDVGVLLDAVRAQGFAIAIGTMHRGIAGVSAPVFDYTGKIVAALTLVGMEGVLNLNPQGEPIHALRTAAAQLSSHVGGLSATRPVAKNERPRQGARKAAARKEKVHAGSS